MVYFYNKKTKGYLSIDIEIKNFGYSDVTIINVFELKTLKECNFDLETCKNIVKKKLPYMNIKDRCKIVNHVVTSINEYKKYINDEKL